MDILENILSQEVVQKLGWTLLHSLWQGAVVVLILAVCLRILQKSSANLRYMITCLGLAVIVLLPVVTFYVIPASAPISEVESVPGPQSIVTGHLPEVYDADNPLQRATEYMQIFPAASWRQRAKNLYTSALPYIVFGWFIGVFALSLWHLGGWAHLQQLKRKNINQIDASLKAKLESLTERLKITRPVKLMKSALVQIPTVVGWFRPVILLPASALSGLTPEQIEALLAHELAHIRRYDYLVNMFQTVVEILGFYHPAVWWISHKMRVERENCCDDLAVNLCGDKVSYARALTSMEEIRLAQGELVIAASGGNLFTRISRLVGYESAGKTSPGWTPVVLGVLLIIALAIPTTLALTAADSGGGLRADSATTHVSDSVDEENINSSVDMRPASHLPETNSNIQIHFECKIYEVPVDLKLFEGEQKEDKVGQMIWLGKEYADSLEALSQENKNVKVLSAPHVMTLDGEEASVAVGADVPYIAGYENGEDAGDEAKPIIKRGFAGLELKIKGKTKENGLRLDLNTNYGQLKPGFGVYKDDEGRQIQVPVIESRKCATSVSLGSDETVVIGGLKSQNDDNNQLFLVITPFIYLPEKDIESQVNITKEMPDAKSIELQPIERIKTGPQTQLERDEIRIRYEKQGKALEQQTTELQNLQVDVQRQLEDLEKRKAELESLSAVLASVKYKEGPRYHTVREGETLSSISRKYYGSKDKWQEILNHNPEIKTSDGIRVGQKLIIPPLQTSAKEPRSERERLAAMAAKFAERGDFAKAIEHLENAIELAKAEKNYGIGLAIEKADGLIRIGQVLPDAPASGSSFKKGDIIEAVDGVSTEGMSLNEVVAAIRGPKGTKVTLTVKSHNQDIAMKETFTRQLPLGDSSALEMEYQQDLDAYKAGMTLPQYFGVYQPNSNFPQYQSHFILPQYLLEDFDYQLKNPDASTVGATRIFELRYASAEELAEVLSRILERRWKGVKDRTTQAVRIIPEPNRNKLIVIASPADIQLIEALIAELDVLAKRDTAVIKPAPDTEYKQDPTDDTTITQVIKLKYADCGRVEQILRELLSNRQFRIATDERTNMLIVVGTESAIRQIMSLVAELDVPGPDMDRKVLDTNKKEKVDSDLKPSPSVK